jgi:hypothetical protein
MRTVPKPTKTPAKKPAAAKAKTSGGFTRYGGSTL